MPTSVPHGSSACSRTSARLEPGGPSSGALPGRAVVGAFGGYGVSTGPLKEVCDT